MGDEQDDPLGSFMEFAARRGLRLTKARLRIAAAALGSPTHFTAADLLRRLKRSRGGASRVSVYRTLPLLIESGLIREALPCGQAQMQLYERVWGLAHHDHLVCESCGAVAEFSDEAIERAQRRVAERHGFELRRHNLELRGLCAACRERGERRN